MNFLSRVFGKRPNTDDKETQLPSATNASTIPEAEKKYYQPDEYYSTASYPGTMFERKVVTFDERKRTSIPSRNGLYVPEILLLSFCGQYPNPKNGYPGYWWFQYGIRNVKEALDSLEARGFLVMDSGINKYRLTDLGEAEIEENAYVAYMHRNTVRTDFTVWDLNLLLGAGDKSRYLEIIAQINAKAEKEEKARNEESRTQLREIDPKRAKVLDMQDEQLASIQETEERYKVDSDIETLIAFWEKIWAEGGLRFRGSHWTFRLPELYIKVKRYNEALSILDRIKQPEYQDKVEKFRDKVAKMTTRKQEKLS